MIGSRAVPQYTAGSTLCRPDGADQAIRQDDQHDGCHDYIHAVFLLRKSKDRDGHACHRSRDEEEQSELNDASAVQREGVPKDRADVTKVGRLATENAVFGKGTTMPYQVNRPAQYHDEGREQHSGAEQIPDQQFHPPVSPALVIGHQILPEMPLQSISAPRPTITILNTRRNHLGCALTRTFVPSSDPART